MLDPITALGLASSLVQLLDFSAKLVGQVGEIRRSGSSIEVAELRDVTQDLRGLTENLKSRIALRRNVAVSKEEQGLDDLIPICVAKSDELILALNKLTRDGGTGTWKSIRTALETIWDKEKIQVLSAQLQTLRQELALRTLVLLNAKSDAHSAEYVHRLDRLDQSNQDIVEVVSITQSIIQSSLADLHAADFQRQIESDTVARHRHEEVIAAILTLKDGNTITIAQPHNQLSPTTTGKPTRVVQNSVTIKEGTDSGLPNAVSWGNQDGGNAPTRDDYIAEGPLPPSITLSDFSPVPKMVLDCLYFRQITMRLEEVAHAHDETFQWIFRDPRLSQKPWDNFPEWLEFGSGCYWISGKAGSGKSTLMKMLWRDKRTRDYLLSWAGKDHLVMASFFFWNVGSSLQRSQEGLLRSLLYDILCTNRHLIPSVLPSLCRAAISEKTQVLLEPTLTELKGAFERLKSLRSASCKFCLFVDGVDEYEGDHAELCELFTNITASPSIKIITSSRPIPSCIDAFSSCSRLRLQDLTHDDIQLYVRKKLSDHPNMHKLELREGSAASNLVDEITTKASGVFLWVMLVVKSLLEGLRNYDHVADLQRRVDALPADLERLYQQMFQSMSPLYKQQASQLLQIVLRAADVQVHGQMSLLQLSYAEERDVEKAFSAPTRVLPLDQLAMRCEATEGRLRSRCCGLVEVQEKAETEQHMSFNPTYVWFLHKTVADFLRMDNVWREVIGFTSGLYLDINAMLLSSCIHEAKVLPLEREIVLESDRVFINLHHGLAYSSLIEIEKKKPCRNFLDELERTATHRWAVVKRYKLLATDEKWQDRNEDQWAAVLARQRYAWQQWQTPTNSFVVLAGLYGAVLYAADRALKDQSIGSRDQTYLLAQFLIQQFTTKNLSATSNYANAINALLSKKANPNLKIASWPEIQEENMFWAPALQGSKGRSLKTNDCSPWEVCLALALRMVDAGYDVLEYRATVDAFITFLQTVEQFVLAGADVHTTRPHIQGDPADPNSYGSISAIMIIRNLFVQQAERSWKMAPNQADEIDFLKLLHARIVLLMTEQDSGINSGKSGGLAGSSSDIPFRSKSARERVTPVPNGGPGIQRATTVGPDKAKSRFSRFITALKA